MATPEILPLPYSLTEVWMTVLDSFVNSFRQEELCFEQTLGAQQSQGSYHIVKT